MSFLEGNKPVLHHGSEAAAQTTITPSDGVDLAGFKECTFLVSLGDVGSGAVPTVTVQQSDDDGDTDAYSNLEGSLVTVADDDDNGIISVGVVNPEKRYLKCIVSRADGDTAVNSIVAILSGAGKQIVTQDSPNIALTIFEPDEGTP